MLIMEVHGNPVNSLRARNMSVLDKVDVAAYFKEYWDDYLAENEL